MANKDITATTIANILALIKTADAFASATMKESKGYQRFSKGDKVSPVPSTASAALQRWFNSFIKLGATTAGTATVSSTFTTTQQWRTDFFNTRTQLLANASPAAISALDQWFYLYTTYRFRYNKN